LAGKKEKEINAVLIVFLSLSVSGSILALILLALKPFLKFEKAKKRKPSE